MSYEYNEILSKQWTWGREGQEKKRYQYILSTQIYSRDAFVAACSTVLFFDPALELRITYYSEEEYVQITEVMSAVSDPRFTLCNTR